MHRVKLIKAIWEFSSGNDISFSYAGNHLPPSSSVFCGKLTHHIQVSVHVKHRLQAQHLSIIMLPFLQTEVTRWPNMTSVD